MNRLSNKVKTLVFFYMEDELDDEFEIYRIATFPYKKGDISMINRIIYELVSINGMFSCPDTDVEGNLISYQDISAILKKI